MDTTRIERSLKYAIPSIVLAILLSAGLARAERKPAPKAEILQPGSSQTLSGEVDVKLKLPASRSEIFWTH